VPTLAHANSCPTEQFIKLLGGVFERSPWVAAAVADQRPFESHGALHAAMCQAVRAAGEAAQLALIRAHPDLVGRAVLTDASAREQAAAGLTVLTSAEITRFDRYNADYKARFGFPFVICARRNKKEAMLRAFPERLKHTREQEIETALDQIFQIAAFRLDEVLP
jgi:2-oxo-4-hydroxy-4-carboxy-5-ureidoimidazoline decarboxylase